MPCSRLIRSVGKTPAGMRLVRSILSIGQPFEESLELTAEAQPYPACFYVTSTKKGIARRAMLSPRTQSEASANG